LPAVLYLLSRRISTHFSARCPKDRQIMVATFRPRAQSSAVARETETQEERERERERKRAKSPADL